MTKVTPEVELHVQQEINKEEQRADQSYAIKLVEKIVFALVSLILLGVATAIINLVLKS